MIKILLYILLFYPIALLAQDSYFISTKNKINHVEKQLTKEEMFLHENFPFKPMCQWTKGMKFISIFNDELMINRFGFTSKSGKDLIDFYHKIFRVEYIEERNVNCPRGACVRTYIGFIVDEDIFEFEFIGDKEELCSSEVCNTISDLAYLDDVDRAKELLIGKTVYTLQKYGNIDDGDKAVNIRLPKFMKVKIVNIGVGTSNCPVKIVLEKSNGEQFFVYSAFSCINSKIDLLSANYLTSDRFDRLFSFTDPRLNYPLISNNHWSIIQGGLVKIGFSKEEAKLSWGEPNNINTTTGSFGVHEQWVYDDQYLYFENGKLTAIQD